MSEENNIEMTEEEQYKQHVKEQMAKFDNAPSPEQIIEWKQEHGVIFSCAFSEDDIFIFRPIKRSEYVKLKDMIFEKQQNEENITEDMFKEDIINIALLWASNERAFELYAGLVDTLHEQIMANSYFINPGVAAQTVFKL